MVSLLGFFLALAPSGTDQQQSGCAPPNLGSAGLMQGFGHGPVLRHEGRR